MNGWTSAYQESFTEKRKGKEADPNYILSSAKDFSGIRPTFIIKWGDCTSYLGA